MTLETQQQQPETRDLEAEVAAVFSFDEAPPEPAVTEPEATPTPEPAQAPSEAPKGGGATEAPTTTAPPQPAPPPAPAPAAAPPPADLPPLEAPAAPAAPPPPAAPTDEQLKAQQLEAQVQALTQALEELKAKPAEKPAETPGTADQPDEVRYALTIPEQVDEMLFGENATRQTQNAALTHIINGLSTNLHKNIRAEFDGKIASLRSTQEQDQTAKQQAEFMEQARTQYFSAFPSHNSAIVKPLVQECATQLGAEFPNLPWGPDYIAALGARVNAAIDELKGATPAAPAAPPAPPTPPAKPAAMLPGSNRGPLDFEDSSDVIADTFSFG